MIDINMATNAELEERKKELQQEFEKVKYIVAEHMLLLEKLEAEYMDIDNILNKRLKK